MPGTGEAAIADGRFPGPAKDLTVAIGLVKPPIVLPADACKRS
jgi:hypothetical protein